jgi:iron complex transport system ATP-binding protein
LTDSVSGPTAPPAVALEGVTVRRAGRTILGPLDLRIEHGERWVVLGPNGAGKTTLLEIIDLALWPTTGAVEVLGSRFGRVDARELRRRIGYAGSRVEGAMRDDLTPRQLVLSARHAALEPWWHVYDDEDAARTERLLDRFGLSLVADHAFGTLSSGERRRVSLARAVMPDPDLLVLDEPAAGLDLGAREGLVDDLTTLAREARPAAIVLVTHHVEEIPVGFDRALVIADGRAVAAGPIDTVLSDEVLSTAFGRRLVVSRTDGRFGAHSAR